MSANLLNTHIHTELTVIPPNYSSNVCLKADTGASKSYIRPKDKNILHNRINVTKGPSVQIPNGTNMKTIEKGILPLHGILSDRAKTGNIIEGLNNASLLSIGQLCDDNCIAIFDKRYLHIFKNGQIVIKGIRNWTDGLWDVRVGDQKENVNMIIRRDKTKTDLAEYLHKCAFSPSLSTFQRAIRKGHFLTWPGINDINFEKYIKNLVPTAKGHLDQERTNLQSTKSNKHKISDDFEPNDNNSIKSYANTAMVYAFDPKEKLIPIKQDASLIDHHEGTNI